MNEHLKIIEKIKEPTSYSTINNKNPSFRYVYIIETRYGLCKMNCSDYDRGFIPNIKSAINKTQYFVNECIEKHGIFYDYSLVDYKKAHDNIEIICPVHGVFEQKAYSHKQGIGCPICTDKGDKQEIIDKLKAKGFNIISYKASEILVSDKYGTYKATAHRIRNNIFPSIVTAIDKTEVFVNKAKEKYNNKYTYENFKYINVNTKSEVTCPIHGDFTVSAGHHLHSETGCQTCGLYRTHTEQFKNFQTVNLYIIRCFNETENFYKIGITGKSDVKFRYLTKKSMPYEYELIHFIQDSPEIIVKLELDLLLFYKNSKYMPKIYFDGITECVSNIDNFVQVIANLKE